MAWSPPGNRTGATELSAALTVLLSGLPIAQAEAPVSRALGAPRGSAWRALAAAPAGGARSARDRLRLLDEIAAAGATPLVHAVHDVYTALVPDTANAIGIAARCPSAVMVASDPHPWTALPLAVRQARSRLAVARIAGRAPEAHSTAFAEVVDPAGSRAFAATWFAELTQTRPADAETLLLSVRTWLARHGGWDAAAADLGVHRNTLRHRMGIVARTLDLDLTDADVRMRLWFALSWWSPEDGDE